jgi:hypothetical protein
MPSLRKHVREAKSERSPIDGFDGFAILDGASGVGWAGLAIGVAVLLLVVVFLPLLGVALELIVLSVLFVSGLVGRVVLKRPWIVEAIDLDDGERSVAFGIEGFRRAGLAVDELARSLSADGPPERLSAGERTVLPRPGF